MSQKTLLQSQETLQDYYYKIHQQKTSEKIQDQLKISLQEFIQCSSKFYLILDVYPLSQLELFKGQLSSFKVLNEKNISLEQIDNILHSKNQNLIIDMKSEEVGAKILFLLSLMLKNQIQLNKVIIYCFKYSCYADYLIKSFQFSTINNNIYYLNDFNSYINLQVVKYELDFQKIEEDIIQMERKIRQMNKFNKFNVIIFSIDSFHSYKIRKQLQVNSILIQKMNIYCEEIDKSSLRQQDHSNIYIVSQLNLLKNQNDIVDNCYMAIDFGMQQHTFFSNKFDSYQEQIVFISKNEALRRQSYLSQNYPCQLIRVYQKQNLFRSNTDDLSILMLKEGNLYKYLCKKYKLDDHFFPSQNHFLRLDSENQEKRDLHFTHEQEILSSDLYQKNYLHQEDTFLRSLVQINQSIINKESFDAEKNIVFSLLQNHIWSKDGNIYTITNFRNQILADEKKSKQQIVCQKQFLNTLISNIISIPCEPISSLIQKYIQAFPQSLFVFSGNKQKGYVNVETGEYLKVSIQSPLKIYSEYPTLIIVHYMLQIGEEIFIQDYTKVDVQEIPDQLRQKIIQYIENFKVEQIKQYFDISTLLFDTIWVNSGELINAFQEQYNCIVKADPIFDSITVCNIICKNDEQYTPEQKIEAFELILNSSKNSLINEKIEFDYYNNAKLCLKKGGIIERIIKNHECFTFQIDNVPVSMSMEKLSEWINEYSDIISIKPVDKPKDEISLQQNSQRGICYIISVEDQSDVNFFIDVFDETEMDNNIIKIKKIQNNLKNKQMIDGMKFTDECIGVRIKWYNLKCEGPALIEYEDQIKCQEAWEILSKEKSFSRKDNTTIQYKYCKGGVNFNNEVDWMEYLVKKCKLQPTKIQINREKKPDHLKQENFVKYIIKNNITPNCQLLNLNSYAETSKKSAKVQLLLESDIKKVVEKYHETQNVIGCTKCFISPFYYYTHQIDSSIRNYIKHALENDQKINLAIQQKKCKVSFLAQESEVGQRFEVIRIKAKDINLFQAFKQKLITYIEGGQIIIQKEKYSINKLQSPEGKLFINDMNTLFNCYIKVSGQVTTEGNYIIYVYGLNEEQLSQLQQKIENMLGMNSKLIIQLNEEEFKAASKLLVFEDIKQEFSIDQIYLNKAKRQLVVEGIEQNINKFREEFSFMMQNLSKMKEQNNIKGEKQSDKNQLKFQSPQCEICLMDMDVAYRLQACRHKFCQPCINLYLIDCLSNIQQFPLKCPKCLQEMVIQDLVRLLSEQQWQKLTNLSLNKYVSENGSSAQFCFTPNCVYIYDPHQQKYRCPICNVFYCIPCKKPNHPGLTCSEAQLGIDILFKNYMLEADARYCPNKACGAILMKIDGCNKVECRNCHKAICWHKKCMIPFNTADECYNHLRNLHGGYYD
ncbi:IBR domain protein (macronuclear) [Tetrahymena thermophila SB210]|uniref:IBR domain protein n=1 Tax=Tetrahymena thermophila (strain SB210) TaxID=312017 RepID=Q23WM6_TETTS|nr:IBR domain protein [Tetrahymena thermophila SB210]EAS00954.2 IBR domain protein [Tetrahymena thermophila SB210]|eukprot:XP_001021199.2 IBR domain protein [Tetrahymena thermophila SB210]